MIRAAALQAMREVLDGEAVAAPRRGKKKAAKKATRKAGKKGKRIRRTSEDVEKLGSAVLAHVSKKPGQRLGDIAKALGVETKDARRPAFALVEKGQLKTTGVRGGTRYFAKGAAPRTAGKKATTKKKATKRKTTKKAAKRKTTKKAAKRKTTKRKTTATKAAK